MSNSMPARVILATVALAGFALSGCSSDSILTAPGSDQTGLQPAVHSGLHPAVKAESIPDGPWTMVASAKIMPGKAMSLSGSRYTLQFSPGAVHNAMQITISERTHEMVDVKFEPDGSVFDAPVTLTIDYSGTPNDPSSAYYTSRAPSMWRFNPEAQAWTAIPGTDNPTSRTYTVVLTGFSRYAMNDGMQIPTDHQERGHTQEIQ